MRWRFCRKRIGRKQSGLPLNSTSCHALTMRCSLQSEAAYCSCGTRLPGSTSTSYHDVGGIRVRLPRVEDLLVMKAIARRPKDLEDLQGLLAAHPELDVASARRWIREFAIAMSMPDMLREFDALLAQRPSQG